MYSLYTDEQANRHNFTDMEENIGNSHLLLELPLTLKVWNVSNKIKKRLLQYYETITLLVLRSNTHINKNVHSTKEFKQLATKPQMYLYWAVHWTHSTRTNRAKWTNNRVNFKQKGVPLTLLLLALFKLYWLSIWLLNCTVDGAPADWFAAETNTVHSFQWVAVLDTK